MKKTLYLLAALVIAGCIARFAFDTWQSTAYLQTHGREGTLAVGQRYNASRWAGPLPLKKIHTYTATLAPSYQVVIESDQELIAGRQYFIRFLTRDKSPGAPSTRLRPLPGSIRLRRADDGTPVKVEDTAIMDRLVEKAIGPLGPGHDPVKTALQVVPGQHTGYVPVLLGGAGDNRVELIWQNSRTSEWIAVALALLLFQAILLHAWAQPWRARSLRGERKNFVHPSLVNIEPAPVPPLPAPLPIKTGSAESTPASASREPAPPTEPILKLRRK